MDNFPSIFTTSAPPHLSLNNNNNNHNDDNNVNMIDHNSSHSYNIEFQADNTTINNTATRFTISPESSSGLMGKDKDGSVSSQADVDSRSESSWDHHHRLMKMEKIIKKDGKKMKKPRYAFQTRSQVDILDDGYRWRKYGQKAVKNNRFPRSYYRCTYQGCNVKKQVQRLSKDEEVVVTTYEGMHSHPIEKSTDNFEHILTQMKIYTSS